MTSPARTTFRPVPEPLARFPVINRRETTDRQIGQITYLIWRLDMFLADREVSRKERKELIGSIRATWARGNYAETCKVIETVMRRFIELQTDQLQAICDER